MYVYRVKGPIKPEIAHRDNTLPTTLSLSQETRTSFRENPLQTMRAVAAAVAINDNHILDGIRPLSNFVISDSGRK